MHVSDLKVLTGYPSTDKMFRLLIVNNIMLLNTDRSNFVSQYFNNIFSMGDVQFKNVEDVHHAGSWHFFFFKKLLFISISTIAALRGL